MVDRYSDFVLYDPPVKTRTLLLWGGPALFLLIGLLIGRQVIRGHRQDEEAPLDTQRARRLLDEDGR